MLDTTYFKVEFIICFFLFIYSDLFRFIDLSESSFSSKKGKAKKKKENLLKKREGEGSSSKDLSCSCLVPFVSEVLVTGYYHIC